MDRTEKYRIGIIGGGVAGATIAELLSRIPGIHVTLIEKAGALAQGPPFCHLHAGGFLYALQIPLEEALSLLSDSLLFARWFPGAIIARPTFVA
eukprot:CAMPEP_0172185028 /NCGR_PEP_ID=MMETSP1050-20130122/19926_1 /TAXON_ID=233186 /ORGANISM="Cryptomonas curvata, Strain CCAP979/52" /LENGTH=93 /DNA_ID=CAMNT_0012858937 /DNA_START=162 /DNA_END=440 /DNA_ORIENTATION=-